MKKGISILMATLFMVVSCMSVLAANSPIVTSKTVIAPFKNGDFALPTTPAVGAPTDWLTTSIGGTATIKTEYVDAAHGNALRITDNAPSPSLVAVVGSIIPVTSDMLSTTFTLSLDAKKAGTANNTVKPSLSIRAYNITGELATIISSTVGNLSYNMSSSNTVWTTSQPTFNLTTQITSYALKPDGVTRWTVNDISYFRVIISSSSPAVTTDIFYDNFSLTYPGQRTVNPLALKDSNDGELTYLKSADAGTTVTSSVTIADTILENYPVTVITALYDKNNRLLNVGIADNIAQLKGNNIITSSIAIPTGDIDGKYLKTFAWDSFGNMKPIFEPVVATDTQPL